MSGERNIPGSRLGPNSDSKLRTFLIWGVLVAVFVVVYQMSATGSLPSTPVLIAGGLGFVVVVVGIVLIINTRHIRRFMVDNNEAIAWIARGELQRAHDVLWRWAEQTNVPLVAAVARHNLGWTLLRQGKLEQCVEVLTNNDEQHARALDSAALYPTSAVDIAFAHALLGNLPDAEQWMDRARERDKAARQPSYPAMAAFARAVIDCRTGRAEEAARALDDKWAEYEAVLTGENVRPLRIVRAFALAAAGPRSAGVAEQALASSRPAYAGEFEFLGKAWPEMATFLAAHQLA